MSKKMYFLIPLVIVLSGAATLVGINIYKEYTRPPEVHYHAGFQVHKEGALKDFSGAEYMQENPCGTDDHIPVDEQLEKAHLHDRIGDVVHVHRENVVWGDLFTNLNYDFSDGEVRAFVNRKEVDNILSYPIRPYDSVVIFVGEAEDIEEKLKERVTKERILEAESMPESCGV